MPKHCSWTRTVVAKPHHGCNEDPHPKRRGCDDDRDDDKCKRKLKKHHHHKHHHACR